MVLCKCGIVKADHVRDSRYAIQSTSFELRFGKMILHVFANRPPAFITNLDVNASVSNDLNSAINKQHINQDTVVVFSVPNAKMGKNLNGAFTR